MKLRIYLEAPVFSYLTAKPSSGELAAGHQQNTRELWDQFERFDVFVSELVMEECASGDQVALAAVPGMDFLATWNCKTDRKFKRMRPSMARVLGFETRLT